jgi:hypothetical protein
LSQARDLIGHSFRVSTLTAAGFCSRGTPALSFVLNHVVQIVCGLNPFCIVQRRSLRHPDHSSMAVQTFAPFAAPDQRLVIQLAEVSTPFCNLTAKSNGALRLVVRQILVSRTIKVCVPHAATNSVQDDPLEAMILANRPILSTTTRQRWKNFLRQAQVGVDQIARVYRICFQASTCPTFVCCIRHDELGHCVGSSTL